MRQIEQLGAGYALRQHSASGLDSNVNATRSLKHLLKRLPLIRPGSSASRVVGNASIKPGLKHRTRSPFLVVLAVISLTGTMGQRFYNQPKLDVGTKAPQTIKAPANASVPDYKTTEEQRKAARTGAIPVLAINPVAERQVYQELQRFLGEGNELRQIAGPFPFLPVELLSSNSQQYLRDCPEWEWRAILAQLEDKAKAVESNLRSPLLGPDANPSQEQATAELQAYRQTASNADFQSLTNAVSQARQRYQEVLDTFSKQSDSELGGIYSPIVFDVSDTDWQKTQTGLYRVAKRMLAQGIPQGLPKDVLREAAALQVREEVPLATQALAIKSLTALLQPNLIKDPDATRQLAELAAQKVKPVVVTAEQGEIIVREGEEITQQDFVLLDYFGLSRREVNWLGLGGFVCLVSGAVAIVLLVENHYRLRRRDHLLLLLLTLSTPLLEVVGLPGTNLPAIGILAGSFYGSAVGVTVVGLLTMVLPVGVTVDVAHLLASAAGGLFGAVLAGRLRSREELALLGLGVGLTQGAVFLLATLIGSATAGSILSSLVGAVAVQALAGLSWSVVALGLSPYLEHVFDLITPIRLAELANPNRPLLKRLAAEAPGTFQHTLFVATLAEAAAHALGCNVELVRTGTLYHDIGKMHDPMGFCENQMGGHNKHDEINDPWVSAALIKKHVTEGLVMARKYRLPKAIQAFIPEHQGRMLIAYFYHQAQQMAGQPSEELKRGAETHSVLTIPKRELKEEDFRYDGPIPQSRETGIVMLADSCEAALRSLKDATHEEALNMVNKILRARWQDNQLVDSGLTREELTQIAEIFVRVWEQFNHKRIAYPKAVLSPR